MNRNLWLLTFCQGLFLTNNVTFIAINGLVGLALAPRGWMATLPVMGYVVGGAVATGVVARTQQRFGRRRSFQIGIAVALAAALACAEAAVWKSLFSLKVQTDQAAADAKFGSIPEHRGADAFLFVKGSIRGIHVLDIDVGVAHFQQAMVP